MADITITEKDRERAREAMDAYHMETNRPAVRDLLAMKPIDASRALLDAFNAWEPFIAAALAEQRMRDAAIARRGHCTASGCDSHSEWHSNLCPMGIAAAIERGE